MNFCRTTGNLILTSKIGYVFCQLLISTTSSILLFFGATLQVASQPAMECLPLVIEPESAFYPDPVVVLDFQSLYPSMIIAYNLCYSTCLGKVFPSKSNVLGVSSYSADPHTLLDLRNQLLLTPNGVLYVQPEVMFLVSEQYLIFILVMANLKPFTDSCSYTTFYLTTSMVGRSTCVIVLCYHPDGLLAIFFKHFVLNCMFNDSWHIHCITAHYVSLVSTYLSRTISMVFCR